MLGFMLENFFEKIGYGEKVGKILQTLPKIFLGLSVIGGIIGFIAMIAIGGDDLIPAGLGILIGAPISSYLGGLPLYAIGLLVERSAAQSANSNLKSELPEL